VPPRDFEAVAEKAERASSMKGNPIALTRAEIVEILESAW
jgi:alcohol dehydrogenase class IV